MKHSPHCIPPAEVGDPGVCICDGRGNPVCPPESGCAECHPTVARPSKTVSKQVCCVCGKDWALGHRCKPSKTYTPLLAQLEGAAELGSACSPLVLQSLVAQSVNMLGQLRAALVVAQRYLHEREFPIDHYVRSAVDEALGAPPLIERAASETLAVDPDDAPEISDEHMSALATKVTLEAQRWTFFKNGMDESDKLRMLADGTDHYDATIDCLRRAAQKADEHRPPCDNPHCCICDGPAQNGDPQA